VIPAKLERGDEVRVVSPAVSLGFIPKDQQLTARERLEALGLRLSFSRNAEVMDGFDSSPVEARVSDLHEAFGDSEVKGMLTTLGGYNSNGLLGYLDYSATPHRSSRSRSVVTAVFVPETASSGSP